MKEPPPPYPSIARKDKFVIIREIKVKQDQLGSWSQGRKKEVKVQVFFIGVTLPLNFLLGLLGWREKRKFTRTLSQSTLGQPLVPRQERK